MELLKEVAHISGRPGLFKIVKPGRTGVIVESLNDLRKREMISAAAKVSVLNEIAIYTEYDQETGDSKPLSDIFKSIKEKHGDKIEINTKEASGADLIEFMSEVLPDFDQDKVYANDIKKIINWYNLINEFFPEALEEQKKEEE